MNGYWKQLAEDLHAQGVYAEVNRLKIMAQLALIQEAKKCLSTPRLIVPPTLQAQKP